MFPMPGRQVVQDATAVDRRRRLRVLPGELDHCARLEAERMRKMDPRFEEVSGLDRIRRSSRTTERSSDKWTLSFCQQTKGERSEASDSAGSRQLVISASFLPLASYHFYH